MESNRQIQKRMTVSEISKLNYDSAGLNEMQVILNQSPHESWIKKNDIANNTLYLPIDKIEFLLTYLFIDWWVEIINYSLLANSAVCHIRLHYTIRLGDQVVTKFQDGIGASPLQTNKGAKPSDYSEIKNNSVQLAMPSAETYAIKDAAEKIGRIFGRDLNRKDLINYDSISGRFGSIKQKDIDIAINSMKQCRDRNQATSMYNSLPEELKSNDQIIQILKSF